MRVMAMRKKFWHISGVAALALGMLFCAGHDVHAETSEDAVKLDSVGSTGIETQADSNTTSMIAIKGTYYKDSVQSILDQINGYRKEACLEGVKDPRDGDALTEDDYVPIEWSGDLEEIAQTRAAEITVAMGHTRPDGKICFTCTSSNGQHSWEEIIAWSGKMSAARALEIWYSEKSTYVNNGQGATGHYTSMIDPSNIRFGLGIFDFAAAGEFSTYELPTEEKGISGEIEKEIEVQNKNLSIESDTDITVSVNKDPVQLSPTLSYKGTDYYGRDYVVNALPCRDFSYSSSDPTVASVDSDGKVKGLNAGTAVITISYEGVAKEVTVTVKKEFSDVNQNQYYYDAVSWGTGHSVVAGYSEQDGTFTFRPNDTCTRGQFVTFLWRTLGSNTPKSEENPFTDYDSIKEQYYRNAVLWSYENNIVAGYTEADGVRFGADDEVTRGQVVTFLWKAAGQPAPTSTSSPFKDVTDPDKHFYGQAMLWASENGIVSGYSDPDGARFAPDDSCTRGQVVTFLWRYVQKYLK